jgi:uncharacterized protein (DUF1800 family)
MTTTAADMELTAHLMRRAGFGATREELADLALLGYEGVVDHLIEAEEAYTISDHLIRRYHNEQSGLMGNASPVSYWLYKMISTKSPMREKVALFWHSIFATGYSGKVVQGKLLIDQVSMFRRIGMGSVRTLLLELSRNPAMIAWLDNLDNHKDAINENFGRELLELFSMGVGNYSEQDIKEAARAFTGWTIANTEYMTLRAQRDSIWPYGRMGWQFEYRPEDHDGGEKEFLGERGNFNGDDIIEIICKQPATAQFLSRHMYHFFVADEPPVPQWPYIRPADQDAVDMLSQVYFDSGYDVTAMLRALFNSDFFKSRSAWYAKVKSPAELLASTLRLTGEFDRPRYAMIERGSQMIFMGQHLTNPPSVEGWHQGMEWIDTGTLTQRLNFASEQFSDPDRPGVKPMIDRIVANGDGAQSSEQMVDRCLDQLGVITVSDETRTTLSNYSVETAAQPDSADESQSRQSAARLLQLIVSSREFQRV